MTAHAKGIGTPYLTGWPRALYILAVILGGCLISLARLFAYRLF